MPVIGADWSWRGTGGGTASAGSIEGGVITVIGRGWGGGGAVGGGTVGGAAGVSGAGMEVGRCRCERYVAGAGDVAANLPDSLQRPGARWRPREEEWTASLTGWPAGHRPSVTVRVASHVVQ